MRFPSAEWAGAFQSAINANPEYATTAQAWEGDVLLLVTGDPDHPRGTGVHLDLAHGRCRSASYLEDASTVRSEFVYEGSRANWSRLLRHEIDPVRAILDGTFRIRGNLAKAMRFTAAAKALVETAARIPVDGT